jgi:hypothetical protein
MEQHNNLTGWAIIVNYPRWKKITQRIIHVLLCNTITADKHPNFGHKFASEYAVAMFRFLTINSSVNFVIMYFKARLCLVIISDDNIWHYHKHV